jgi:hypothetical protein
MAVFSSGDTVNAIVADIGSSATKIGFAGEDYPRAYFRSVRRPVRMGCVVLCCVVSCCVVLFVMVVVLECTVLHCTANCASPPLLHIYLYMLVFLLLLVLLLVLLLYVSECGNLARRRPGKYGGNQKTISPAPWLSH